jgi:hypothetical protein
MKKALSEEALRKEAELWGAIKKAVKEHPVALCHK